MIYTSYFAKLNKLPETIEPIAICGGIPEWYKGAWTKKLAPKWWFFSKWKENHDNDFYIENFNKEVLYKTTPTEAYNLLMSLSNGKTPCMICYEKPSDFCHRHLVAGWFNKNGIECEEYKFD